MKVKIIMLFCFISFNTNSETVGKIAYLFNLEIANSCVAWSKASTNKESEITELTAWCLRNQHKGGFKNQISLTDTEQILVSGELNTAKLEIVKKKILDSYNEIAMYTNSFEDDESKHKRVLTMSDFNMYTIYILEDAE
jgi:hypothetical protein